MAIDVRELATRPLDPVIAEELDIFERTVAEYLDGRVDEDAFRVFRLNHGVYGQRQGGHNQMLRVKVPHGRVTAEQLETFAYIAETYSRGWGHLTTRQNVQFHFIQLEQTPEILRLMASVGLTSREACGDTVRNVMGCHLAGACPQEVLDITPWAEATTDFLLRHPYAQRLPRKFKINFSGCATDCGQAMFNDVGVVATTRTLADGTDRSRLQGVRRRRPRRQPAPRAGARGLHAPRRPAADDRRVPAHVRPLRQPRQQDPRPHEVARRHDGHRRAARAHPQGAQVPARRARLAGRHPRAGAASRRRARGRHARRDQGRLRRTCR